MTGEDHWCTSRLRRRKAVITQNLNVKLQRSREGSDQYMLIEHEHWYPPPFIVVDNATRTAPKRNELRDRGI